MPAESPKGATAPDSRGRSLMETARSQNFAVNRQLEFAGGRVIGLDEQGAGEAPLGGAVALDPHVDEIALTHLLRLDTDREERDIGHRADHLEAGAAIFADEDPALSQRLTIQRVRLDVRALPLVYGGVVPVL